jgi:hypothetical protein
VPSGAIWLGGLGALPFVFLATSSVLLDEPSRGQAAFALSLYGAVILSFLGGVHWGLAIAGFSAKSGVGVPFGRLAISIVPALIAWAALFLPGSNALFVLAAAFVALALFDSQASRAGEAPAWYPRLRWPLTVVVVSALVLGALAQ